MTKAEFCRDAPSDLPGPLAGGLEFQRLRHVRADVAYVSIIVFFVVALWSCAPARQERQGEATKSQSSRGFTDASLIGSWSMTATVKPFATAKFGGLPRSGPYIGSGRLQFDGHGTVSGVVDFGVLSDLKGTYHVGPDGTGTIEFTTTTQSSVNKGRTRFRIANADEITFQSRLYLNTDRASAAATTESQESDVVGTFRKAVH